MSIFHWHKVLFLTAGLGEENFCAAARRVELQVIKLSPYSRVINLSNENLRVICPEVSNVFADHLSVNTRGYGYMAWKSEIVMRAVNGDFGSYEYVVWVDSGCEVNSSKAGRATFLYWLALTKFRGYLFFKLETPEAFFTKRDLFKQFPVLSPDDFSGQLQTTFFILQTSRSRQLVQLWFSKCLEDIRNIDESTSHQGEREGFNIHRHDQSVFSLSAKSLGLTKTIRTLPNGAKGLFRFAIPIWASRNRSGFSINPRSEI